MRFIFAICWTMLFPILLLYLPNYFLYSFTRLNVYASFNSNNAETLNAQFLAVLDYLKPFSAKELDVNFFSREDILHLQDVKQLYLVWFALTIITLLLTVMSRRLKIRIGKRWSIIIASVIGASILWLAFNFDSAFVLFHEIAFPYNNYWLLDPRSSNLIKFLPQQIFAEIVAIWISTSLLLLLVALVGSRSVLNKALLAMKAEPSQ